MPTKSATDLVKEGKPQIENLTPQQVKEELSKGNVNAYWHSTSLGTEISDFLTEHYN